jgi:hypothetical protein
VERGDGRLKVTSKFKILHEKGLHICNVILGGKNATEAGLGEVYQSSYLTCGNLFFGGANSLCKQLRSKRKQLHPEKGYYTA